MRFIWDENKNRSNQTKHRVSFETAARVFADPLACSVQERIENGEQRWQTLGMVDGCLLLLVAHTVFEENDGIEVVRIVSARRADLKERKRYEQENC